MAVVLVHEGDAEYAPVGSLVTVTRVVAPEDRGPGKFDVGDVFVLGVLAPAFFSRSSYFPFYEPGCLFFEAADGRHGWGTLRKATPEEEAAWRLGG